MAKIDTLKTEIKGELKIQKEKKIEENKKRNANLREVILYTKETCPYCINFKKVLDEEGIKYTEKEITQKGVREEFNKVATLTGQAVFPTIFTNDNYLIPNRDFNGLPQGAQLIIALAQPTYENPPNDLKTIEMLKQISSGLQSIHKSLQPIQKFIIDVQKEIEEEELKSNEKEGNK